MPGKMEPLQRLQTSPQVCPKLRASCGKAPLPGQQHSLQGKGLPQHKGQDHLASLTWLGGRAGQGNAKDGMARHQTGQGDEPPSPGAAAARPRCSPIISPAQPWPCSSCCHVPGSICWGNQETLTKHGTTESLGLEGPSGDHPLQPPCQARLTSGRSHSNASRELWNASGDSSSFLGSLAQCSASLSVNKFFLLTLREISSRNVPLSFLLCQGKPKLESGKAELTGLEGQEATPSTQKVLEGLEAHFPTETWALDWDYGIDKGLSRGLWQEDLERPVPSEMPEEHGKTQASRNVPEHQSNPESLQCQDKEGAAAAQEAVRHLQSVSPAPPGATDTEEEPATSQSPALPQWGQAWPSRPREQHPGQAGTATTTTTACALPALPWHEPLVPVGQAGACLLPAQPLGHRSPSATATHGLVRRQRCSLFWRVLRAVPGCSLAPVSHESSSSSARLPAPGSCLQVTV